MWKITVDASMEGNSILWSTFHYYFIGYYFGRLTFCSFYDFLILDMKIENFANFWGIKFI